jgi:hypothetical protein
VTGAFFARRVINVRYRTDCNGPPDQTAIAVLTRDGDSTSSGYVRSDRANANGRPELQTFALCD